ncbi:MAG: hypothetical protein GDYSWBUE_002090, partial [Candidatus Fervidibacterota bacterium]
VLAEELPWQNRPFSVRLNLPPLAVVYLKPGGDFGKWR